MREGFFLSAGYLSSPMAWQPGPGFEQYSAQPGMHPGMQGSSPQVPTGPNNPLNDVFYGAAPGLLGAYLGNSKDYVQSNVSRYFASHDIQYYFQVTDQYVRNKLKVVLCPFLHKGHWTRIAEQVAGGLKYKPPRHDINAPDLYLPIMALVTYILLSGFLLGMAGKYATSHDYHMRLSLLSKLRQFDEGYDAGTWFGSTCVLNGPRITFVDI